MSHAAELGSTQPRLLHTATLANCEQHHPHSAHTAVHQADTPSNITGSLSIGWLCPAAFAATPRAQTHRLVHRPQALRSAHTHNTTTKRARSGQHAHIAMHTEVTGPTMHFCPRLVLTPVCAACLPVLLRCALRSGC